MRFIRVWCEYDFGGSFGSNNNEEVFSVSESVSTEDIEALVKSVLSSVQDELDDGEDLFEDGLAGWEFINIEVLEKESING